MRRFIVSLAIVASVVVGAMAFKIYAPTHYREMLRLAGLGPSRDARLARYYQAVLQQRVDSILVIKHLREMYVYHADSLQKIYQIALGDAPVGHKHFEGDERTAEGKYFIDGKNPYSSCHKNLGISYPNNADRAYARKFGKPTGGDIKIHGILNGQGYIGRAHLADDWTNGCVALTDEEIDELYVHTSVGIPILILP